MKNIYAESPDNSLFVKGIEQYTAEGSRFFIIKNLDMARMVRDSLDHLRYHARRRSIKAQLFSMSDHMLADIGIERGDIPVFSYDWAKSESPLHTDKRSPSRVLSLIVKTVSNLKQWMRRQSIEAQFRGMSDRMLEDIGVERADISAIARQWVEVKSVPEKARIIGPNTEIDAIVPSSHMIVGTVANDTTNMRVAS